MERIRSGWRRAGTTAARAMGLSLLMVLAACGDKSSTSDKPALSADEAQYLSDENLWRIQRQEKLTQPDGWTSLIGLRWPSRVNMPSESGPAARRIPLRALLPT